MGITSANACLLGNIVRSQSGSSGTRVLFYFELSVCKVVGQVCWHDMSNFLQVCLNSSPTIWQEPAGICWNRFILVSALCMSYDDHMPVTLKALFIPFLSTSSKGHSCRLTLCVFEWREEILFESFQG